MAKVAETATRARANKSKGGVFFGIVWWGKMACLQMVILGKPGTQEARLPSSLYFIELNPIALRACGVKSLF